MLIAMGVTAALCILIGIFPGPLYGILPYPVNYVPYTTSHVITQLQLLIWSALAFTFLKRTGLYPPELPSVNLDTDWVYRRVLPGTARLFVSVGAPIRDAFIEGSKGLVTRLIDGVRVHYGPGGIFAKTLSTGNAVFIVTLFLVAYLVFYL